MNLVEDIQKISDEYLDGLVLAQTDKHAADIGGILHSKLQDILLAIENKTIIIAQPDEVVLELKREDIQLSVANPDFLCVPYRQEYIQDQLKEQLEKGEKNGQ